MAEQNVNKSALINEYLDKHKSKKPAEISRLISQEKGVVVSPGFVSAVKSDRKKGKVKTASNSMPRTKSKSRTKTKSKAAASQTTRAPAVTATAAVKTFAVNPSMISQHVANLKAAVQSMGKDEAKRIIELF